MALKRKKKKDKLSRAEKREMRTFRGNAFLKAIKPKEKVIFHSDYFEIDGCVATILTFRHNSAAHDNFGAFWGILRIPANMPKSVTTMNFEQVARMSEGWITEHQSKAEGVSESNAAEQTRNGSSTTRHRSSRLQNDLAIIAQELNNGASYLNVHNRLLVKAPDLETLEEALATIDRLYMDRLGTISAAPYIGDQRKELASLFGRNETKRGKGEYYTSTEYAGSYHLVTHGLEDTAGEYVGRMRGDVNNSAVLLDVDNFRHHVVVASEQINKARGRAHVSDMWGSKLGQACMLDGHRIVHLLLDKCDMDALGPRFESITHTIDMNHGDVNMFEMFGSVEDELSIFPAQMQKLILMAEPAYETTETDRSIIRSSLEEIATEFYINQRMWHENAKEHRDRLRVVGIPHDQVPRLQVFVSYLDTAYKSAVQGDARDEEVVHAFSVLRATFRNLLSNNGDLFNTITTPVIDSVIGGRRVIYDFSKLMERGQGVAMAQLVNIVDFAVSQLDEGDLLIIHACERIERDEGIRRYLNTVLDKLYRRGGRAAFLYNSVESALNDVDFNNFDKADYTLFGNMSDNTVALYQERLGQQIPRDLARLVTDKSNAIIYIRRGFDNVVFEQDIKLNPEKVNRRVT